MKVIARIKSVWSSVLRQGAQILGTHIYIGKSLAHVPEGSFVLFPYQGTLLCCGLTGIVAHKPKQGVGPEFDPAFLSERVQHISTHTLKHCRDERLSIKDQYLGGSQSMASLKKWVQDLKKDSVFAELFMEKTDQEALSSLSTRLDTIIDSEGKALSRGMGLLGTDEVDIISVRIEDLKDIHWCLSREVLDNLDKVKGLMNGFEKSVSRSSVMILRKINTVLNSIDRLEVRGRDSAGISLMFILTQDEYLTFRESLANENVDRQIEDRLGQDPLVNQGIGMNELTDENGQKRISVTFTYKIAAEVGNLGDNIRYLRRQITNDSILQIMTCFQHLHHTVSAHTRWASVGAISEPNCHPVDNSVITDGRRENSLIHVCLNGDIDNYQALKEAHEKNGIRIHGDITTDTKIIPLQIEKYITKGCTVEDAFRMAVSDFDGSHAISMHTDLAPGKLFLAQKGSGQAIFVGMADGHYMPTSEVYGFVEETADYLKMDGEKIVDGKNGRTQGQIFILDQASEGGVEGIRALQYDGTLVHLSKKDIKHTDITSRDIDRQGFPHYFLKEISESPISVAKTLQNRWKINKSANHQCFCRTSWLHRYTHTTYPRS